MPNFDFKTATPDTSISGSEYWFGADSQSAATPSIYSVGGLKTYLLGGGSLAITAGKTLTATNSLTLTGTDGTTMTFPSVSATLAALGIANLFTTAQTISPVTDVAALTARSASGGTANILQLQDSSNNLLAAFDKDGLLTLGRGSALTGQLKFANSTNANVLTLQAGATSGALTFTLPTADGTSGQVLQTNGSGVLSWKTDATNSPGGSDTQVQFNNSSAFGGDSTFTFNSTSKLLTANRFGLSGNISSAAWTTNGIRYSNTSATITDTTSTGTVATAYTNVFGGNTIAASNSTTFTNYYTTFIAAPTAGTNVTLTNPWALGLGAGLNIVQGIANENVLLSTGYSLTGSNAHSVIDLSGTWNTSGTPTALKLNITDTSSNSNSLLIDLQVGGTSKVKADKSGNLYANRLISDDPTPTVGSFAWDSSTTTPAAAFSITTPQVTTIHKAMRRCLLKDDGTVNYYLSPTDSTKKADGTSATLTGADGMVMVEIPKFYTKRDVVGNITTWSISQYPLTGYTVHPAFIKAGVEVNNRYYSAYDACLWTTKSITGITQANPAVVTCTAHGLVTGDVVTITGVSGMTEINNQTVTVTYVDANSFSIGVNSTGYGAYTSGGSWAGYLSGLNLDSASARYVSGSSKLSCVSGLYPMVGLTRANFRTAASNRGTGWTQLDFALFSAVQLLYLIEIQSFYSQNILGAGNTNGTYLTSSSAQSDSPHTIAGASNARGNQSTNVTTGAGVSAKPGTSYMCYRGIENFYGNCWNWVDGINVNVSANGNVHITNNYTYFADDTSSNMTLLYSTAPTTSNYASAIASVDNYFMATSVSGGSSSTYLTDYWNGSTSSNRGVAVGGNASNGATAGAFGVSADYAASSYAIRAFGGRVAF